MSDGIKIFSLETISGDSLLNAYLDVFTRFYPDFDETRFNNVLMNGLCEKWYLIWVSLVRFFWQKLEKI